MKATIPMTANAPCRRPAPSRGFTLVELMVAMVLGLMIASAMLMLYVRTVSSNVELAKANSQIENGRYAIQVLENDVAHAGYWAGFVPQHDLLTLDTAPGGVPTAIPDPCLAYNTTNWNPAYKDNLIGIPIQVSNGLPGTCSATLLPNRKADTDVLVVRFAAGCAATVGGTGDCDDTAGKLYLQASNCNTESATPYVVSDTGFTLHDRDCATVASKHKLISHIYYVRDYSVTVGDGIPTLVRSAFGLVSGNPAHETITPLIEGIEGFRVELGVDNVSETGVTLTSASYGAAVSWQDPTTRTIPTNRGDGTPDSTCTSSTCTAFQLMNAVSARIYVLARSREATPGYTDSKTYTLGTATPVCTNEGSCSSKTLASSYKRHLFSTTIRLANVSGRRETP
jgi:type IV pilus assembly protein PilW